METVKICRLCHDESTQHTKITDSVLAKLITLVPTIEFSLYKSWSICQSCSISLKATNAFKLLISRTDNILLTEIKTTGSSCINLSSFVNKQNDVKNENNVCRICLKICHDYSIHLYESTTNSMPFSYVKNMCDKIFSMDLCLTVEPIMCNMCWEFLQKAYYFKKMVIKKENIFQKYLGAYNLKIMTEENLKFFKSTHNYQGYSSDEESLSNDSSRISNVESTGTVLLSNNYNSESASASYEENNELNCYNFQEISKIEIEEPSLSYYGAKREDVNVVPDDSYFLSKILPQKRGSRDYKCSECKFVTKTRFGLRKHSELHQKEKLYCDLCSYVSTSKYYFDRHKRKHTEVRNECQICQKIFKDKWKLTLHLNKHHPEACEKKMKVFQCDKCPYNTLQKAGLTKHKIKHGDTENLTKYNCLVCEYSTYVKFHMNKHILVHSGVKPFACKFCKYSTNNQSNLNTHIRGQHKNLRGKQEQAHDGKKN